MADGEEVRGRYYDRMPIVQLKTDKRIVKSIGKASEKFTRNMPLYP